MGVKEQAAMMQVAAGGWQRKAAGFAERETRKAENHRVERREQGEHEACHTVQNEALRCGGKTNIQV